MLDAKIYQSGTSEIVLDLTSKARGLSFTTAEHGYAALQCLYPCTPADAFHVYDRAGLPRVTVSDNGVTIWEGRLEDVAIVDGGVRLGAFGYQRALSDTLYTASFTSAAASAIAGSLVSSVYTTNSTQLSNSTALISSPGTTFTDSYEDARPADILNRLAEAGDTSGNAWEWGVYDGQALYFRQRGSAGRAWYVDAASLELERSLDKLYNSAYGIYTGQTNTKARTATSTDSTSVSRYGITRQAAVGQNLNDTTIAAYARDTFLAQYKVATPRAKVKFARVFDASGGSWPLYHVRAGDTLTIRNLPATSSTDVDSIRTFYIVSTTYSADDDTLDVELSSNTPTIDRQISQSGGNVSGTVSAGADSGILTAQPQYEFNNWTPTFSGTGTAGTFTYVTQSGLYTRIGNLCFFSFHLAISGYSVAPTGNIRILGWPFTSANVTSHWFPYVIETSGITFLAGTKLATGYMLENSVISYFVESPSAGADTLLPASAIPNSSARISGAGVYRIA